MELILAFLAWIGLAACLGDTLVTLRRLPLTSAAARRWSKVALR